MALLQCKKLHFLYGIRNPKILISFSVKETHLPYSKSKNGGGGRRFGISTQERSIFLNNGNLNINSLSLAIQVLTGDFGRIYNSRTKDGYFPNREPENDIGHGFAGNSNGNSKGGGGDGGGCGGGGGDGGEMEEWGMNSLQSWKNILAGVGYSVFRSIWNYGGPEIEIKLLCTAVNFLLQPYLLPIFEEIAEVVLSVPANSIMVPLILIPLWFPIVLFSMFISTAVAEAMSILLICSICFCLLLLFGIYTLVTDRNLFD